MATAPAMMAASAAIWSFIFRSFRHLLGLVRLCVGLKTALGKRPRGASLMSACVAAHRVWFRSSKSCDGHCSSLPAKSTGTLVAERDDRTPPAVQPGGGDDGHLGVRPLEQDLPGHPAGLAADDGEMRAVTHGRVPARARRRATRAAAPAMLQQGRRTPKTRIPVRPA